MVRPHNFKAFPELTNRQMEIHYLESPHKQITEDFRAKVVKVTDGDTISVRWRERDFDFPIRLANLQAPELNERGGKESKNFLEGRILGKEVDIVLSKSRVEKWGRLLAYIVHQGQNINEEIVERGFGVFWVNREDDKFFDLKKELGGIF